MKRYAWFIVLVLFSCTSSGSGGTIHDAAKNGDLQRVKALLKGAQSVDQKDDRGFTALHYAARNGHLEIVQLLVSKGAQLESKDRITQATPLIWAAYGGQDAVVRFLVEHGADINATAADDSTPLDIAIMRGGPTVTATLQAYGAKRNLLNVYVAGLNKAGDVLVDNHEPYPVSDCTITFSGGFSTRVGYFGARDRLMIPAEEFKRDDGTRYGERSRMPDQIKIECLKPVKKSNEVFRGASQQ